jgi:hypothetical protein
LSKAAPSLAALVAQDTTSHGPRCWMCTIPERDEAEQLHAAGTTLAKLERALQKLHPDECTLSKVSSHFRARHHER